MPLDAPAETIVSQPLQSVDVERRTVPATNKSTALLPSNQKRLALTIYNDATTALCIDFGNQISLDSFLVKIPPRAYWESPIACTEALRGIWEGEPTGKAHIREMV